MPEFEQRWARYARRVHSSWRMDETAVSVRGGSHYLYRAVDKHGKTVDAWDDRSFVILYKTRPAN
jgi:transposase-like protein